MGEKRGSIRVAPYLDEALHERLRKLAFVCGLTKSKMAYYILEFVLYNPDLVQAMQAKHGTGKYSIIPIHTNGKNHLHLNG